MGIFRGVDIVRWQRAELAVLGFILVGCVVLASFRASVSEAGPGDGDTLRRVFILINQYRVNNNLPPLVLNARLGNAAQIHSDDMATTDNVSHTGSDGSSPWDRIRHAGYNILDAGEAVAAGQGSPEEVVNAWINSLPHRHILLGNYRDIGIGHTYNPTGSHRDYWTADLGMQSNALQVTPTPGIINTPTPQPRSINTPTPKPRVTPRSTPPGSTTMFLYPPTGRAGWVVSREAEGNHFGAGDLFAGMYQGEQFRSALQFDLGSVPAGAHINYATLQLIGRNSIYLGAQGTWETRLLTPEINADFRSLNYRRLTAAVPEVVLIPDLSPGDLGPYHANFFDFPDEGLRALQQRLETDKLVTFSLNGPEDDFTNLFSWDTGVGIGPLSFHPVLWINYSLSP
ncbi:MAG: CAP domain-containing protein [Chloroflexi bacterium]|nr:CAP domain-containing protein [Chloroflexota bacterium]